MTAFKITTKPTEYPVSVEEVKAFARIEYSEEDLLIESRLRAAIEWTQGYTNRTLCTTSYTLYLDEFSDEMRIPRPPLISVESITYTDENGIERTLDPSIYTVDAVSMTGRVILAYGMSWPSTQDIRNAVRINYTAGYGGPDDVPDMAREAIKILVKGGLDNRDNDDAGKRPEIMAAESLLSQLIV